jgi:hypothetical protein
MTIRTADMLNERLANELAWRRKELVTFRFLVGGSREYQAEVLRRAGVALMYAHWEGFVKIGGTAYVEFVALQRLKYKSLSPNFFALAIKAKLHSALETPSKPSLFNEVVTYFLDRIDEKADLLWKNSVQTKSNLNSIRLRDIIVTLGLDYRPFEIKEKTVIDKLLELRNSIAHGRQLRIKAEEYEKFNAEVIELMEEYKNQIENHAQIGQFRR